MKTKNSPVKDEHPTATSTSSSTSAADGGSSSSAAAATSSANHPPPAKHSKKSGGGLSDKKYVVIQCTGYLQTWPLTKIEGGSSGDMGGSSGANGDADDPGSCMSCLVAVGCLQQSLDPALKDSEERNKAYVEGVVFNAR